MDQTTQNLVTVAKLPNVALLEPITLSDKVHSWLNMLNRIVAICNVVDYPNNNLSTRTPANIFGFMTSTDKLYLDGIKPGIYPNGTVPVDADLTKTIDINAQHIVSYNAIKKASYQTFNASSNEDSRTIVVDSNSIDIQCVDASVDLELLITAKPDSNWYTEKLVSINVKNALYVSYTGNNFNFVNNSLFPNIEWRKGNKPDRSYLLSNTYIVYKFTFVHSRVLVEVIENTQLVENYKTPSSKYPNSSLNGVIEFDATSTTLTSLTNMANEVLTSTLPIVGLSSLYTSGTSTSGTNVPDQVISKILYLDEVGNSQMVSRNYDISKCRIKFEMDTAVNAMAQWSYFKLTCCPIYRPIANSNSEPSSPVLLASNQITLDEGRNFIQIWSTNKKMVVKLDYSLNLKARTFSVYGLSLIKLYDSERQYYDE